MKERAITFGPDGILTGVLTEPEKMRKNAAAVVMSNVGINHHVGPQRVWVELARRLAANGIPAFRFDSNGLGDSAPRPDLLGDIERSVLDMEDALGWLSANVTDRFELASLCSGTDVAHKVAVKDARVKSAVFIDGYKYETPRSILHEKVLCYADRARWKRMFRQRFPHAFGLELDKKAVGWVDEIFNREYPSRRDFERDLTTMVDRQMRLLFVFSGEALYHYKNQFWDALDRKDWGRRVSLEFFPKADHTFTFRPEREVMLNHVERWIVQGQE